MLLKDSGRRGPYRPKTVKGEGRSSGGHPHAPGGRFGGDPNDDAGQFQEGKEHLGVALPPRDEPTERLQPGGEAFNPPSAAIASKGPTVLCLCFVRRLWGEIISILCTGLW
jgi:hypothetical protein